MFMLFIFIAFMFVVYYAVNYDKIERAKQDPEKQKVINEVKKHNREGGLHLSKSEINEIADILIEKRNSDGYEDNDVFLVTTDYILESAKKSSEELDISLKEVEVALEKARIAIENNKY